jgi:hypothetical protein
MESALATSKEKGRDVARATTEEKRQYLRQLVHQRPRLTIEQARAAIGEKFGSTLNTPELNRCVKLYRRELEEHPPVPEVVSAKPKNGEIAGDGAVLMSMSSAMPLQQTVQLIKTAMISLGIAAIRVLEDGEVELKMRA